MQSGPLSGTLRCSIYAASSASSSAAVANLVLQEAGSAAQPLVLLRALSNASACIAKPGQAAGQAAPGAGNHEQWVAAQRQHCRQLSHYAASTSGRAGNGYASPILGVNSGAAAWQRVASTGLAPRWRAFSSSTAAPAAARRTLSSSPERSFASQPAYAYDEPDYGAAGLVDATAALQRARQAVETLKAQALERQEEARALAASSSPFGAPQTMADLRRMERTEDVADLVKVQTVEEMVTEAPVWERLSQQSSSWHRCESMAALHLYQQEVQMGHDADALSQGARCAFGHTLGHLPFLRSGVAAAQQGFGLQSELGRAALPARLAPAAAAATETAVSARTRSALDGLRLAMDLTRSPALEQAVEAVAAGPLHSLVEAEATMAAAFARADDAGAGVSAAVQLTTAAGLETESASQEAAAALAGVEELDGEVLPEESRQGGLLEALDWQERLRHENPGERLSAAQALRARRQSLSAAKAAGAAKPGRTRQLMTCPVPAASEAALLTALSKVKGVRVTSKLAESVAALYATPRLRILLCQPLAPQQDPKQCIARAGAMATLLVEELGSKGFEELMGVAPWVLLLDPAIHGHLQLAALHLVDFTRAQRARVVRAMPRLLQLDVDSSLLPMFEYLQSLGLSTEQMKRVLLQDPYFAHPSTLPMLKAAVAFWRGKGMSRDCLAKLIAALPDLVRSPLPKVDLKLSWLADHTGFTIDDVADSGDCFTRSLAGSIGPRVAFAQHKGFKVVNPVEASRGGYGNGRVHGVISLRRLLQLAPRSFVERMRADEGEYEAFREQWLRQDFAAWLQRHRPGIEHYRTLTHPLRQRGAQRAQRAQ